MTLNRLVASFSDFSLYTLPHPRIPQISHEFSDLQAFAHVPSAWPTLPFLPDVENSSTSLNAQDKLHLHYGPLSRNHPGQ